MSAVVRIQLEDGQELEGQLGAVEFGPDSTAATVEFNGREGSRLPIGSTERLGFWKEDWLKPLYLSGRLVFKQLGDSECRCQFELGTEAETVLSSLLGRRKDVRVRPDRQAPLRAVVRPVGQGGPVLRLPVSDISTSGISLRASPSEEAQFAAFWELEVALELPNEKPILLITAVRYRRLSGPCVYYGMRFDPDATPMFPRKQDLIAAYVMRRQSELLSAIKDTRPRRTAS